MTSPTAAQVADLVPAVQTLLTEYAAGHLDDYGTATMKALVDGVWPALERIVEAAWPILKPVLLDLDLLPPELIDE